MLIANNLIGFAMNLIFHKMTERYAEEILQWQYLPPYDIYNLKATTEALNEFLIGSYRAICSGDELIGFYCTGQAAQVPKGHDYGVCRKNYLDIGLGMKPDMTGKGFGREFFSFILSDIEPIPLRLTVATFNQRAIRLYRTFGFEEASIFTSAGTEFAVFYRAKSESNRYGKC